MIAVSLVMATLALTACKKSAEGQQARKYTCTHHPEIVQDAPGTCPKCNMKLVLKD
jgi:Cu(I)/Ag(I) efflux system membrane fusion protein